MQQTKIIIIIIIINNKWNPTATRTDLIISCHYAIVTLWWFVCLFAICSLYNLRKCNLQLQLMPTLCIKLIALF